MDMTSTLLNALIYDDSHPSKVYIQSLLVQSMMWHLRFEHIWRRIPT